MTLAARPSCNLAAAPPPTAAEPAAPAQVVSLDAFRRKPAKEN